MLTGVAQVLEIRINLLHVENHITERLQDGDSKCWLDSQFAGSDTLAHSAIDVRNRIRQRGSKFPEPMFLDYENKILISRGASNGFDECRGNGILSTIQICGQQNWNCSIAGVLSRDGCLIQFSWLCGNPLHVLRFAQELVFSRIRETRWKE